MVKLVFMSRLQSLLLALVCLTTLSTVFRSEPCAAASPTTVKTGAKARDAAYNLAARVLEASGGLDRIKAFNATVCRATGKLDQISSISGSSNVFDFSITTRGREQRIEVSFMGQPVITGYDGKTCWTQQGKNILPTDEITAERVREDLDHGLLLLEHALEPGRKLRLGDVKKIRDRKTRGLIVMADDGKETTFYVDEKSHLVLRSEYDGVDIEQGVKCLKAYEYRDYRQVANTLQPFESVEYSGDSRVGVVTISNMQTGIEIPRDYFSMPVQDKPERLSRGPVTLPFKFVSGEILARVKVNNEKELVFLIDTGATQSIIDLRAARGLGSFDAQDISITTGSGAMKMNFMTLKTLGLGDLILEEVPVAVADLKGFSKVLEEGTVDGLIGANVLKRFQLTIDYDAREITLRDPDTPIDTANGVIVKTKPSLGVSGLALDGKLDDKLELTFLIDTGAAFNHVSSHLVKDLVEEPVLSVGTIKGLDGLPVNTGSIRFRSLKIGDLDIEGPVFSLGPAESKGPAGLIAGGNLAILGNPVLSRYRITIDYRNQLIKFETTPEKQKLAGFLKEIKAVQIDYLESKEAEKALGELKKISGKALARNNKAAFALAEALIATIDGRTDRNNTRCPEIQARFRAARQDSLKSGNQDIAARVLALWALYLLESKPQDYNLKARELTTKALRTSPTEPLSYAVAGMILMDAKENGSGSKADKIKPVELIDQALMLDPSNWLALKAKYVLACRRGDRKETALIRKQVSRYYQDQRILED